jgi:Protein of unknown function (DUF2971)
MTISTEEMQKYVACIEEQVKFVKVLEINNQEIIWHYTTGDALLSIVESGALYATQVSCLNDSTEVLYGEKLLRDAFIDIQTQNTKSREEAFILERIIKNIAEEPTTPTNIPSPFFVTCFSKEKDDLSQWRAYSGGENGYAIAFLAGAFFNRGSLVVRVNYEKDQHKEVAKKVANATLQFFKEGIDARPASGIDNTALMEAWANEFLATWQALISRLAPMVKDPAFRGENEYRIVHELQGHEFSKLRLRQKQTLMSRHLPLVFPPPNSATQSDMLPIMEVMVGPGRHKEISRVSVDTALRQKGYTVPVTMSSIPFQMT